MARIRFKLNVESELDRLIAHLHQLHSENDFSQVVLQGITAIQKFQRRFAPVGRTGSIPRSIKPARIVRWQGGASATSITTLPHAIFTNEGTGTHKKTNPSRYEIVQERRYQSGPRRGQRYTVNIDHPGIKGTQWWKRGFEAGKPLALQAFRHKVGRILRARGRF